MMCSVPLGNGSGPCILDNEVNIVEGSYILMDTSSCATCCAAEFRTSLQTPPEKSSMQSQRLA